MRTIAGALAFTMLLVACSAANPTPEPSASVVPSTSSSPSPDASPPAAGDGDLHGQVAYVAGTDAQVYLLDLATGESRQLTEFGPEDAELTASGPMRPVLSCGMGPTGLRWSPDGERLALTYGSCDGVVHVVSADGEPTRIGDGRAPAFSNDGRLLVYGANVPYLCGVGCRAPEPPGGWGLQVVDLEAGTGPAPMSADGATDGGAMPIFSPDDAWIAFTLPPALEEGDVATFAAVHLVRPDGSELRHVADGAWPAGWLADGRLLVVDENTSELHALDLEAGESDRLGSTQGPGSASPDGELVLQSISDPATGTGRVQLVTLDGEVLAEAAGWGGAWAPEGTAVAVAQPDASAIVILARDGTVLGTYETGVDGGIGELAWRPGS